MKQNWIITAIVNNDEGHAAQHFTQFETDAPANEMAEKLVSDIEFDHPNYNVRTAAMIHGNYTMDELRKIAAMPDWPRGTVVKLFVFDEEGD